MLLYEQYKCSICKKKRNSDEVPYHYLLIDQDMSELCCDKCAWDQEKIRVCLSCRRLFKVRDLNERFCIECVDKVSLPINIVKQPLAQPEVKKRGRPPK